MYIILKCRPFSNKMYGFRVGDQGSNARNVVDTAKGASKALKLTSILCISSKTHFVFFTSFCYLGHKTKNAIPQGTHDIFSMVTRG